MRKLLLAAGALLLITSAYAQKLPDDHLPWIPFAWKSESISGKVVEKTSFSIPLSIEGIPHSFDAQFDLGAATTMLYGNTIAPYLEKYGVRADTTQTIYIQGEPCPVLPKAALKLGAVAFQGTNVALFQGYGDLMTADSISTPTIKHAGTVAADLFNDGVLVIDYPNERLCRLDSIPGDWHEAFELVDIDYIEEMNWIFLPLQIGDATHKILFDTGSSMFPLLSSPSNIAAIADTRHCTDSLTVGAWGNQVQVNGYAPTVKIRLGTTTFAPQPVYASEYLSDETLNEAGFWAIVGNRYFLDRIVVIDYRNKRFGISR